MLTGGPCEWDGSPESAPTNSEFNCSDDSCEDCTLVGSDTDPADFGANLFLQTTPDCQWILEIFGFAEAFNVRTETKGYDGGEPRGIYSGGSVVT